MPAQVCKQLNARLWVKRAPCISPVEELKPQDGNFNVNIINDFTVHHLSTTTQLTGTANWGEEAAQNDITYLPQLEASFIEGPTL